MEQKKVQPIFTLLGVLLTILFIAACSAPQNLPTASPQATDPQLPPSNATAPGTQTATTPGASGTSGAGAGLCSNPYYPIRQGATWSYKSSGGPAGDYSFTDTISAVGDDSFTLATQIGELTNLQDWDCTPQGLVAHQLGGAPAAMLNSQGIQLTLNATNANGVVFQSQIGPGDTWRHTLDVSGHVRVAGEEGQASGNVQMDFAAVGTERVTVPAGTFEAMKIQVDTTLNVNVSYEGITLPVSFSATHTYWFSQGVGWVKATGTGTFLATSFSETIELQSYNVP